MAITVADTLLAITDIIVGATTTIGTTDMDTTIGIHTAATSITIGPITGDTVTGDDTTATVTEINEAR
ncbi:MAG: hypothetical protein ACYTEW_23480 [Planctomycetota bacterium]